MTFVRRLGKGYHQDPAFHVTGELFGYLAARADKIPEKYSHELNVCAKNGRLFLEESEVCHQYRGYAECVAKHGNLLFTVDRQWKRLNQRESYELVAFLERVTNKN